MHPFGKRISNSVFGCFAVAIVQASSVAQETSVPTWLEGVDLKPTYTEGVGLIIEHRCAHCHRPGEIAPMSFMTYAEVRKWARDTYTPMDALIRERAMPPWPADPAIGAFSNPEFITQPEMDLLIAWLKSGMPRGAGEFEMKMQWVEGWNIGQPDAVFELPEYTLAEDAKGEFKTFTIKTEFPEDRWIVAAEATPQDTTIVTAIDAGSLGTYQLGNSSVVYPAGMGRILKAGAEIEVRVHYRKDAGYAPVEKSRLGVVFAKSAEGLREVVVERMEAAPFTIPAGKAEIERSVSFELPADSQLISVMPIMHERGVSVRYELVSPDGAAVTLLSIPSWDARWKYRYAFAKPIAARKGSTVRVTARYDNSEANRKNPDPWTDATPGPTGETLQGWVSYVPIN